MLAPQTKMRSVATRIPLPLLSVKSWWMGEITDWEPLVWKLRLLITIPKVSGLSRSSSNVPMVAVVPVMRVVLVVRNAQSTRSSSPALASIMYQSTERISMIVALVCVVPKRGTGSATWLTTYSTMAADLPVLSVRICGFTSPVPPVTEPPSVRARLAAMTSSTSTAAPSSGLLQLARNFLKILLGGKWGFS